MRVLLTGGSGFIAAHVLDNLLERGHSVVTTVRSQEKADKIKASHSKYGQDKLDFAIVEDIAEEGAFDKAVISSPPFEAVIHTASPFHFNVTDVQKQLLDPAIIGTTGILKSIKKSAPTVKRVVITSSFASIVNGAKGSWPEHTYSEADWNPITHQQAMESPSNGYRASKTFAERAAWDFIEQEQPNFDLATMCPPLVFGPVVHYLNSLDNLNTSNQRVGDLLQGKKKNDEPDTGLFIWVDVRDLALSHVLAIEKPDAGNKRFFLVGGHFSSNQIVEVLHKNFPKYRDALPPLAKDVPGLDTVFKADTTRSEKILGVTWRSFEECIVDTAKSLQEVGL